MDRTNAERQARWQARRKLRFREMEQRIRELEAQVALYNAAPPSPEPKAKPKTRTKFPPPDAEVVRLREANKKLRAERREIVHSLKHRAVVMSKALVREIRACLAPRPRHRRSGAAKTPGALESQEFGSITTVPHDPDEA
jgi:hypothetical protein